MFISVSPSSRNGQPDAPVWLLTDDGNIEPLTLEKLVKNKRDRIENSTILLPPSVGGLRNGSLDGDSDTADDVADEWRAADGTPRRIRVWDDDPQFAEKIKNMRLIRTIDTDPVADEELEGGEAASRRYWHWYELPKWADNDGSNERRSGGTVACPHR